MPASKKKVTRKTAKTAKKTAKKKRATKSKHDSGAIRRVQFTVDEESKIQRLAVVGATTEMIAFVLDCDEEVLRDRMGRDIELWRQQATDNVIAKLYQMAMGEYETVREEYDETGALVKRIVTSGKPSMSAIKSWLWKRAAWGEPDLPDDPNEDLMKGPIVLPLPTESEWREQAARQQRAMLKAVSASSE